MVRRLGGISSLGTDSMGPADWTPYFSERERSLSHFFEAVDVDDDDESMVTCKDKGCSCVSVTA